MYMYKLLKHTETYLYDFAHCVCTSLCICMLILTHIFITKYGFFPYLLFHGRLTCGLEHILRSCKACHTNFYRVYLSGITSGGLTTCYHTTTILSQARILGPLI